jgi:hypothetical protein
MIINTDALWGLVVFAMLLVGAYGPWQWVCTDYARQLIFEKRDRLFDLAHKGAIDFSSEEYTTLRRSLENLIRFCHEVTMTRLIYFVFITRVWGRPRSESHIHTMIEKISNMETKENVKLLFHEAHRTVVIMMLFKSPFLLAFILVLSPLIVVAALIAEGVGKIRRLWAFFVRATEHIGNTVQAEAEAKMRIRVIST